MLGIFYLCLSVCICGLMNGARVGGSVGEFRKLASCRVQLGDPPRPSSAAEVGLFVQRPSAARSLFTRRPRRSRAQGGAPLEGAEVVADEVVEGEAGALEGAEFGGDEVDGDLPKIGAKATFVAKALAHIAVDYELAVFAGDAAT